MHPLFVAFLTLTLSVCAQSGEQRSTLSDQNEGNRLDPPRDFWRSMLQVIDFYGTLFAHCLKTEGGSKRLRTKWLSPFITKTWHWLKTSVK